MLLGLGARGGCGGEGDGGAGEKSGTTGEHAEPPEFRYTKHEARQPYGGMLLAAMMAPMVAPNTLTATELAHKIDACAVTAEAIVRAHLERIDERDDDVLAWSHLARDAALERAKVLDRGPRQGLLHGIPMGVKDIIDSFDQPTTYGSPIYKTHQPLADIPATDGAPDQGTEGIRFMGYTLYDPLIMWDLSSATAAARLVPGLATKWYLSLIHI